MDVNGTPFHLVMGERDWQPLIDAAGAGAILAYDPERGSLGFRPALFRFPPRQTEPRLTHADRRGADADRYDNVYWIDRDRSKVRIRPAAGGGAGTFWSPEDLQPVCAAPAAGTDFRPCLPPPAKVQPGLRGLAVTEDHYLVVGTLAPPGLFVFDLHGGGLPRWLEAPWPTDGGPAYRPFDLARAQGGGVWVLDHATGPEQARYWKLDRYLRPQAPGGERAERLLRDDFKPLGGSARTRLERELPLDAELDLISPLDVAFAIAILALPDDSVLILDSDPGQPFSVLHRRRCGEPAGQVALDAAILAPDLEDPQIKGHDLAFVPVPEPGPGTVEGRLLVVADDGNQAFAFALHADPDGFSLRLLEEHLPMRRFSGKGLVAHRESVLYDLEERWIPLAGEPRPRYPSTAVLAGLVLDGKEPDCVWHRLLLDGCIPDGTSLVIQSRAANRADLLPEFGWTTREPAPHLRTHGSELPFHQAFTDQELRRDGTGTFELLFQTAVGRFLELRFRLSGSGRASPRLRALRVYYPRFSYLHQYLPAVYAEDRESAAILDRYLANPEGILTVMEGRVAAAEQLLDPRTAPAEFLEWLAGWLGAALDPAWDQARRRLFIAGAVELFRWRGTPGGLLSLIRLAIEPCPDETVFAPIRGGDDLGAFGHRSVRIVEHFLRRRFPGVALGLVEQPPRPALAESGEPWTPAQGALPLHQRYRDWLERRYGSGPAGRNALNQAGATGFSALAEVRLSPVEPANPTIAQDWRMFIEHGLGFTYAAVTSDDVEPFRSFLTRRYQQTERLNQAYQLTGAAAWDLFSDIALPAEDDFPASGQRLADWIEFASSTLPIRHAAHHFTVLVPTEPGEAPAASRRRLAQVEAIVAREKPAHTAFDVQLFWALFTVGSARLGIDTVLGEGSRFVALILGETAIGQGFLPESHPWNVEDRWVLGRDPLRRTGP